MRPALIVVERKFDEMIQTSETNGASQSSLSFFLPIEEIFDDALHFFFFSSSGVEAPAPAIERGS